MAAYDTWLRKSGFSLAASALALVLFVSAAAMYSGITTAQQQQQIVNDTRASILTVVDLHAAVTEAETTVYEYIVSNGASGSQSYQAARSRVSNDVQHLEAPQGIGSGTSRDITQLRRLTPATLAALQSMMLLAQSGQSTVAIQRLSVGDVGQSLQSLRSVIERIQVAENGVLRNQISSAASAARALLWISAATTLFAVGAFIAVLVVLRRTLALREQFAQERIRADAEAQVKILEATYQRMKIFLEVASHEIRTPLTSLKLGIQLSLRAVDRIISKAQEDVQQYGGAGDIPVASLSTVRSPLNRALVSTGQLERLVADLVDSTHIEVSALEMRPTARDLGQIIDECVEEQSLFHPDRTIVVSKPDNAITVVADGERIRQVVVNYLNNAHKFSEKHRPITVAISANTTEAMVRVQDKGPGIPSEEQSRIWEQFYRVPGIGHVSGSSEGFGLGLFISSSIIQRHGGRLGVESVVGQGSTFWFTLPLPIASQAPSPVARDDSTLDASDRDGSSRRLRYGMA